VIIIIKRIDSLSEIDLANVTLPEIRHLYGSFQSYGKGKPGRSGVQTAIGDILESVWYEVAERVALRDYESWIVDALEEWTKGWKIGISQREVRKEALEIYSMRIFDNKGWVSYIPFNRKYRPDFVKNESFLTVITECCKKPGEMTREQYMSPYPLCPICGRTAVVTIISNETEE
jgi:hypothetical protein